MEDLVAKYLISLNLPVSKNYISRLVLSHPTYPSILCISDVLNNLGLITKTFRINSKDILKVEFPYLLKIEGSDEAIDLIDNSNSIQSVLNKFPSFDGIILKELSTDGFKDEENSKLYSSEIFLKKTFILSLLSIILLTVLLASNSDNPITDILFLITTLVGVVTGYLLFTKEIGVNYKLVDDFCTSGRKSNCEALLSSKAATIFKGRVSLSTLVLSYFATQAISQLALPVLESSSQLYNVLLLGGGLTIPIVIYSVYYQAFKLKIWCRLCMIVNTVLVIQMILFILYFIPNEIIFSFSIIQLIIRLSITFLVIGLSLTLLRFNYYQLNTLSNEIITSVRIKHNPEVFRFFLVKQNRIDNEKFENEIILGSRSKSIVEITLVASLSCHSCARAIKNLIELILKLGDRISLKIILKKNKTEENKAIPTVLDYWINNIKGGEDSVSKTQKMFDIWYSKMDVDFFNSSFKVSDVSMNKNKANVLANHYSKWTQKHQILETPQAFINGFKIPIEYKIEELSKIIPLLIDLSDQEVKKEINVMVQN